MDFLTASIAAPRERHDTLVRDVLAPIVRELAPAPPPHAVWFSRFNKPTWGVKLTAGGPPGWLAEDLEETLRRRLDALSLAFTLGSDDDDDKWLGGPAERDAFAGLHTSDSLACCDLLDLEAGGDLATSRAQWSLLVVEGLLDLFGVHGEDRLEAYRHGFAWELELGRWDDEVLSVLDAKYGTQKSSLLTLLETPASRHADDVWGGAKAALLSRRLFDALQDPIDAIRNLAREARTTRSVIDLAVLACHAHANRLGIHATQEATSRYLLWRARGGSGATLR